MKKTLLTSLLVASCALPTLADSTPPSSSTPLPSTDSSMGSDASTGSGSGAGYGPGRDTTDMQMEEDNFDSEDANTMEPESEEMDSSSYPYVDEE